MSPRSSESDATKASAGAGRQPLRILVVDDDAAMRQVLSLYLEAEGHEVKSAETGARGLEFYMAEGWNVVLTDREMPGMSGNDLAEAIKRINPKTPVILVTGSDARPGDVQGQPFDLVIPKPFTREILRTAIRKVCS
jgi:CheY-like chemotaxis protein